MKYKYNRKDGILLAESDSPIKFNTALFPIFKDIEPEVSGTKKSSFGNTTYNKEKEER